jgi:DivIVA domain-containing protein
VALDRQSIEKRDFPVGRRGYDPDAVDAHLSALADEVDEFRRSSRRRSDTLASSASEQVRAIVEAAESSANEITREAESEARDIRHEATEEARATREQATEQAREYVSKVSEATNAMLGRIDAMENELSTLIEALREGGNRLNADLQLLEGDLAGMSDSVVPRPRFEREEAEAAAAAAAAGSGATSDPGMAPSGEGSEFDQVASDTAMTETIAAPEANVAGGEAGELADDELYIPPGTDPSEYDYGTPGGAESGGVPVDSGAGAGAEGHDDDAEGARLIALNMALNGTPREETERYLSENFQLADAHGLLDEVYASVEG